MRAPHLRLESDPGKAVARARWSLLFLAAVSMGSLSGCFAPLPRPGQLVALQVYDRLTVATMYPGRQGDVVNALEQGVSESAIRDGRLVVVTCAQPTEARDPQQRWVVLLPPDMALGEGDVVSFGPGVRFGEQGPPGRVTARLPPPPSDALYRWKYGETLRCGEPAADGTMQGRYGFGFSRADLREALLHRERVRGLSEEEVRDGRIVLASCSQGPDGWKEWTVRLPPELSVERGDYIVARAGTPDDRSGSISEALQKIPRPPEGQTYPVQGSSIIRCNAVDATGQPRRTGRR